MFVHLPCLISGNNKMKWNISLKSVENEDHEEICKSTYVQKRRSQQKELVTPQEFTQEWMWWFLYRHGESALLQIGHSGKVFSRYNNEIKKWLCIRHIVCTSIGEIFEKTLRHSNQLSCYNTVMRTLRFRVKEVRYKGVERRQEIDHMLNHLCLSYFRK